MKIELIWKLDTERYADYFTLFCGEARCGGIVLKYERKEALGNTLWNLFSDGNAWEFEYEPLADVKRAIEETAIKFFRECFGDVEIVITDDDLITESGRTE